MAAWWHTHGARPAAKPWETLINSRLTGKIAFEIVYIERLQLLLKMDMGTKKKKLEGMITNCQQCIFMSDGNPFPLHCYSIVTSPALLLCFVTSCALLLYTLFRKPQHCTQPQSLSPTPPPPLAKTSLSSVAFNDETKAVARENKQEMMWKRFIRT